MLACHNFWHWALFRIDIGDFDGAVEIFDQQIEKRVHSGALLDIVDSTSLLKRLEFEGIKIGPERWENLAEICRPHADDHILAFNDIHLFFSFLGSKKSDWAIGHKNSMLEFARQRKFFSF